jgi:hypothetical protein
MSKARLEQERPTRGGDVVIHIDQRAFFGLIAVVGIVAIFAIGLWLGRSLSSAGGLPVASQRAPAAAQQQPQLQPQQQLPPGGQGVDPNLLRPAGASVPIGDNPRLALPTLEATDYVLDFGDISPSQPPIEEVVMVRNVGTKELVIDQTTAS